MLDKNEHYILLSTKKTSLLLFVNEIKKLTCQYYGKRIASLEEADALTRKRPYLEGTEIQYNEENPLSLNHMKLAYSTLGKGDYFAPSMILENEDSTLFDFVVEGFEEIAPQKIDGLPTPHDADQEVVIHLKEEALQVLVDLHYVIFEDSDTIGSYVEVINKNEKALTITKVMSLQLPLINEDFQLWSTYGNWISELQIQKTPLLRGRQVIESLVGYSSARHNPAFALVASGANFHYGNVYGFNLIYSSNFEDSIEMDSFENVRVQVGISSTAFRKVLQKEEKFTTPMAVMTYSSEGLNGLGEQFHFFVNSHVIPSQWNHMARPIAYNNWEATNFKFNKRKIFSLMKVAAKFGMELFVLDDGWFSTRNDDSHGLGDWEVNEKKLPGGLSALAQRAKKYGMKFGIWMEPEMVNDDTKLYRDHPDWIIHEKFHKPSKGRHQYVLDLTKKEVQEFVYESVAKTLRSAEISYLKWDCNRCISDYDNRNGTFFYDYCRGLYSVLERLIKEFPNVLFENCASGGNRFDLGMLSYFPQSWMSDDTDSYQRLLIQEGGLLFYPPSVMSNHVAAKTSNQLLRYTSYDTKFNIAALGVLGYELDLNDVIGRKDPNVLIKQIDYYKEHRELFQWGKVIQDRTIIDSDHKMIEFLGENEAIVSQFILIGKPNPKEGHLIVYGLEDDAQYEFKTRKESIALKRFGNLVNMVSPIHINPDGRLLPVISKYLEMYSEEDSGTLSGAAFKTVGATLAQEWSGVGYDERVRMLGDFGSRMYYIRKK